jgi:hypothetical protein
MRKGVEEGGEGGGVGEEGGWRRGVLKRWATDSCDDTVVHVTLGLGGVQPIIERAAKGREGKGGGVGGDDWKAIRMRARACRWAS